MARDAFVDTSGYFALLVRGDDKHDRAAAILSDAERKRRRFVTTDYVLDETITLLGARGHRHLIPSFLGATLNSTACRVEWTTRERFAETAAFALRHADKHWSFTDCLSFVVMKQRRLSEALTTDVHFEEAGFVALLRAK